MVDENFGGPDVRWPDDSDGWHRLCYENPRANTLREGSKVRLNLKNQALADNYPNGIIRRLYYEDVGYAEVEWASGSGCLEEVVPVFALIDSY